MKNTRLKKCNKKTVASKETKYKGRCKVRDKKIALRLSVYSFWLMKNTRLKKCNKKTVASKERKYKIEDVRCEEQFDR